jgi:hypothetical protein
MFADLNNVTELIEIMRYGAYIKYIKKEDFLVKKVLKHYHLNIFLLFKVLN